MEMHERNSITKERQKIDSESHPNWLNQSLEEKGYEVLEEFMPKIGKSARILRNGAIEKNSYCIEIFQEASCLAVIFSDSILECCEDLEEVVL